MKASRLSAHPRGVASVAKYFGLVVQSRVFAGTWKSVAHRWQPCSLRADTGRMKNSARARATDYASINEATEHGDGGISLRRLALVAETGPNRAVRIWEPVAREASSIPSSTEALHVRPRQQLREEIEERIIATLLRPLSADETHHAGNENREHQLRAMFAQLLPVEALVLRRRIDADRNDDRLVAAFRRLIMERRKRLTAFLADPRRAHMSGF